VRPFLSDGGGRLLHVGRDELWFGLIDAQPILRAIFVRDTGFEFKNRYIVTTSKLSGS
jgi:hypothetical protein